MSTPAPPTDTRTMKNDAALIADLKRAVSELFNAREELTELREKYRCTCAADVEHAKAAVQAQTYREALEHERDQLSEDAVSFSRQCTELRAERNELREKLAKAREALEIIANSPVTLEHEHWLVSVAKDALDAPAADTDAKPPLPSVVGARNLKVCRICGNKISTQGWPVGAAEDFGELIFPEKVTLNFGYEFAHTACLAADTGGKEAQG